MKSNGYPDALITDSFAFMSVDNVKTVSGVQFYCLI